MAVWLAGVCPVRESEDGPTSTSYLRFVLLRRKRDSGLSLTLSHARRALDLLRERERESGETPSEVWTRDFERTAGRDVSSVSGI